MQHFAHKSIYLVSNNPIYLTLKTNNMKTSKLPFLLLASLLLICLSCSKEAQTLNLDKTRLIFGVGVDEQEFNISTEGKWKIEAEGLSPYYGANKGDADWYSVTPISGEGNTKVVVTSKEETAGNSATLVIKYDGQEKRVSLVQQNALEKE